MDVDEPEKCDLIWDATGYNRICMELASWKMIGVDDRINLGDQTRKAGSAGSWGRPTT